MKPEWIYLSPHFDDAVFSCGGLIWEQVRAGNRVSIWTICAGEIPAGELSPYAERLHARWGSGRQSVENRRQEDNAACSLLSASYRRFAIPDCIYRRANAVYPVSEANVIQVDENSPMGSFFYPTREAVFGALHPMEAPLVSSLARALEEELPGEAQVVCPITLGGHVDHQLTRAAAEMSGRSLWYYADYPYVEEEREQLELLEQGGWRGVVFPVSPQGLEAWQAAIAAHRSQISTFWSGLEFMREAVQDYLEHSEGSILWRSPASRGESPNHITP